MAGLKKHSQATLWLTALVAGAPVSALAQAEYGATATVTSPIASTNREDATSSGTELELAERPAAAESVADVLIDAPGARPFRTGTLGSFTSASLRGADYEHTAVLLGDIPIGHADAGAFDLDTIPASMLERVVVYRGGAPVWLSQGEVGGLIQLIPKRAHTSAISGSATVGSFGLREAAADTAVIPDEKLASVLSHAAIRSSRGDFQFLSDNNTSLDTSDDFTARRKNADALDGNGLIYFRQPIGNGALDAVLLSFQRVAGEPRSAANPVFQARRNYSRYWGAVSYHQSDDKPDRERLYRFQVLAATSYEITRFTDLFKEIRSFQTSTDDRTGDVYGRAAGSLAATKFFELTLIGSARYEDFRHHDPFARWPFPPASRITASGAAEVNVHGDIARKRFEFRPSLRYEHSQATLVYNPSQTTINVESSNRPSVNSVKSATPTYRVAGAIEVTPGLTASASAATGKRVPSVLELFGDGALIIGNPALSQERSISADTGLVAQGTLGSLWGEAEARLFSLHIDDRIVYVVNSLHQLVPRNLRSSQIYGIELGARGNATRYFRLSAAVTLMDTEGKPGKELPNQARTVAHLQPEIILGPFRPLERLSVFAETNFISSTFDDPDNATLPKPSQFFLNAGVSLGWYKNQIEFRFTVRDVLDRRGQDFRGFQLPGRTLLASLTCQKEIL